MASESVNEFSATLIREKFVLDRIDEVGDDQKNHREVALGNRFILPLISMQGTTQEEFIIRAQNMHMSVRFAGLMAKEFYRTGPLAPRLEEIEFDEMLKLVVKGYEEKWNPSYWLCVYHKGEVIFEDGIVRRSPLLDIIEKCDAQNPNDYDSSVQMAKEAFKKSGYDYTITHDSNIATLVTVTPEIGKTAAIVRGPNKKTTFNFTAHAKDGHKVQVAQCLNITAAFLEGVQVAFAAGMLREQERLELIDKFSPEAKKGREAGKLLGKLNLVINQFENLLDVNYRPERPQFTQMIDDAAAFIYRQHLRDEAAKEEKEKQQERADNGQTEDQTEE